MPVDVLTDISYKLLYELNLRIDDLLTTLNCDSKGLHLQLSCTIPETVYNATELASEEARTVKLPAPLFTTEVLSAKVADIQSTLESVLSLLGSLPIDLFTPCDLDLDALRRENAEVDAALRTELQELASLREALSARQRTLLTTHFSGSAG